MMCDTYGYDELIPLCSAAVTLQLEHKTGRITENRYKACNSIFQTISNRIFEVNIYNTWTQKVNSAPFSYIRQWDELRRNGSISDDDVYVTLKRGLCCMIDAQYKAEGGAADGN